MRTSDKEALARFVSATKEIPLGSGKRLLKPETIAPWGEGSTSAADLREGLINLVVTAEDAAADPPRDGPVDLGRSCPPHLIPYASSPPPVDRRAPPANTSPIPLAKFPNGLARSSP